MAVSDVATSAPVNQKNRSELLELNTNDRGGNFKQTSQMNYEGQKSAVINSLPDNETKANIPKPIINRHPKVEVYRSNDLKKTVSGIKINTKGEPLKKHPSVKKAKSNQ